METGLVQERTRTLYCVPREKEKIQVYENAIPDFVVHEIEQRYGALYSSVAYLRLVGKLGASTCTYVAFSDGAIRSVFLFEREGTAIRVVNSTMKTEQEEVARFADHMFGNMPGIDSISFPGVHMDALQVAYPYQRFFAGEDIVVSFAGTADEYAQQLGKNTRKSIKRHATALKNRHPGARYTVLRGSDVDARLVDFIAGWNRQRMSGKHKVSSYKDDDVRHIAALVARNGLVGTIMLDGRILAGTVCCRIGDTCYMAIMGHDGDYDEFSLGLLCNYWTAMECLRMHCREINLMGGRLRYKYNLLGESRKYDLLAIYRNRAAFLRNVKDVARTALHGYATEAKFAILDCERREGKVARGVTRILEAVRAARQRYRSMRRKVVLALHCGGVAAAIQVAELVPLP